MRAVACQREVLLAAEEGDVSLHRYVQSRAQDKGHDAVGRRIELAASPQTALGGREGAVGQAGGSEAARSHSHKPLLALHHRCFSLQECRRPVRPQPLRAPCPLEQGLVDHARRQRPVENRSMRRSREGAANSQAGGSRGESPVLLAPGFNAPRADRSEALVACDRDLLRPPTHMHPTLLGCNLRVLHVRMHAAAPNTAPSWGEAEVWQAHRELSSFSPRHEAFHAVDGDVAADSHVT
eukprot:711886-Hanusia_phi.AAC.2